MCKVLSNQFACGHYFLRCSSRCSGTRSKITRSARRAACSAEAYINILRASSCPQCLKDSWLETWKTRLSAARTFHKNIAEGMPGVRKVQRLVEELEEQFEVEAWEIKKEIPHVENTRVRRVQIAREGMRRGSLLRFEVIREDAVVREEGEEEKDNGDNEGWEPICHDPLHPIDTDYDLWTKTAGIDEEYLTELALGYETREGDIEYPGEDSFTGNWEWGSGDGMREGGEHDWMIADSRETSTEEDEERNPTEEEDDQGVSPQLPDVHDSSPPNSLPSNNSTIESRTHTDQVNALIETFNQVISIPAAAPAVSQPPSRSPSQSASDILATSDRDRQCNNLHDERGSDGHYKIVGPMNLHSKQTKYIAFRKKLTPLKYTNPREYYEKWLEECRFEIREMVGPEGPRILNPKKGVRLREA